MNDDKNNDDTLSTNASLEQHENLHELSITQQQLSNGCEYTTVANNNTSSKRRKLILHFDNRNTLQVANSVSATTIEQGLP
ncbi:unnamed protein product [Rotaria socialis]|uniref:Uncharacterized protein n=1 Tax=Rotaria socialis TaxID=392032 RepID=A0A821U2K7_9BILA|nr:unnamed protein product [Rotaria socialis]